MARYTYKCKEKECSGFNKEVVVVKPMAESSRVELCKKCNKVLDRVWGNIGVSTGDGFKS